MYVGGWCVCRMVEVGGWGVEYKCRRVEYGVWRVEVGIGMVEVGRWSVEYELEDGM